MKKFLLAQKNHEIMGINFREAVFERYLCDSRFASYLYHFFFWRE